jgi:hypothetical protein
MLDQEDIAYFISRARRERAIATTCEDNAAALAHLRMADAYESRLSGRRDDVPQARAEARRQ